MKDIGFEHLETVADDESVKAPEGLVDSIETALAASEFGQSKRRPIAVYAIPAALTAAASLAIVLAIPTQPKDTYDDPQQAYAEVEKAFAYMSDKFDKGLEIASEATPVIETTTEVFKR